MGVALIVTLALQIVDRCVSIHFKKPLLATINVLIRAEYDNFMNDCPRLGSPGLSWRKAEEKSQRGDHRIIFEFFQMLKGFLLIYQNDVLIL
jgi:hypothetical protein